MNTRDDEENKTAIDTHWYEIVVSMIVAYSYIIANPDKNSPVSWTDEKYQRKWETIIRTSNFTEACELHKYFATLADFISVDLILHCTLNGNCQYTIKQAVNQKPIPKMLEKVVDSFHPDNSESDDE